MQCEVFTVMRRVSMLIMLLVVALAVGGCRYSIVESDAVRVGFLPAASAESAEIGLGSRDEDEAGEVRQLQDRLAELGLLDDEPDGIFGNNTYKALVAFQKKNRLEQTGTLDADTEAALYEIFEGYQAETMLEDGASGFEVEQIQSVLRIYGFSVQEINGTYDKTTRSAVKSFQKYAVDCYGTEFDVPVLKEETNLLPVTTPAPNGGSFDTLQDTATEVPMLTPEPTLRPRYAINGNVSTDLFDYLISGRFPAYHATVREGDEGIEVVRLQNRLSVLEYFYDEIDGHFGRMTQLALELFQQENGLQKTGIADAETQSLLYSDAALELEDGPDGQPFYIKVSIEDQRVYVYRYVNGEYSLLVKQMTCSTGAPGTGTPKGVFTSTGRRDKGRWHYFVEHHCWAQYAFVITGNILFHSVLFNSNSENTLRYSSVYNLGHRASHGCVRLAVEDAKWICTHCSAGQKIEVY